MTRRKEVVGLAPSSLSGGAFTTTIKDAPALTCLGSGSNEFAEQTQHLRDRYDDLLERHYRTTDGHTLLDADAWAETEQVVTEMGHLVAARAERFAGVDNFDRTDTPEFEALTEARDRFHAVSDYLREATGDDNDRYDQQWEHYRDLQGQLRMAEDTVANLDAERLERLAEGYSQALADIRPMGGIAEFDDKTTNKAAAVFEDASNTFPTDWIEHSNTQMLPLAKIARARAHYSHHHVQTTKRKQQMGVMTWGSDTNPPAESHSYAYEVQDSKDHGNSPVEGQVLYKELMFEALPDGEPKTTIRQAYLGEHDPQTAPRGAGWARYERTIVLADGTNHSFSGWRRPVNEMVAVEERAVPEIRTNNTARFNGHDSGYAVAVHEMSHRFEHVVPEVANLEEAFLNRRCGDNEATRIYRGKDEFGTDGGFVDLYVGKRYPPRSFLTAGRRQVVVRPTEVLSVGTEALFGGHHGGLVGAGRNRNVDADHRAFTLGVMALAGTWTNDDRSERARTAAGHV